MTVATLATTAQIPPQTSSTRVMTANHKTAEFKTRRATRLSYRLSRKLPKEAAEDAWNQMQTWFRKYNVLD